MTKKIRVTKKAVMELLDEVFDPELHMSIVDLGLIYNVVPKKDGSVEITMTLTTMGCPLFDVIKEDIYLKLKRLHLKKNQVAIEITFDPPWSMDRMTPRGKALLGI